MRGKGKDREQQEDSREGNAGKIAQKMQHVCPYVGCPWELLLVPHILT